MVETLVRLKGELSSAGFEASIVDGVPGAAADSRAGLERLATERKADAVVAIVGDVSPDFVEVWVIDTEVSQLVSLGPIRADGTYDLPAGIDPSAFPIVDVSIEPLDGDPRHSGNSVLRGQLTF